MTPAQRRKQNIENARKSTGPVTEDGKDASRRNALKHGLTAEILVLPEEDPAVIQAQADAWNDAYRPVTHDEDVLVDNLALGSLRLQRLAKAENEILAEQVRYAEVRWDEGQEAKVHDLAERLQDDPARTLIHLQSFGAGVDFLLDRWEELMAAFDALNFWNSLALVKQAIRLYGSDPDQLARERLSGSHFAVLAVSCIPGHKGMPRFVEFLADGASPEWRGLHGQAEYDPEDAARLLRELIDERIAELKDDQAMFRALDEASRANAGARAMALEDSPRNRLLVRYTRATESSFDRTLKTLTKMQAERAKTEAAEARSGGPKADRPNEADQEVSEPSNPLTANCYVEGPGPIRETWDGGGELPSGSECDGPVIGGLVGVAMAAGAAA